MMSRPRVVFAFGALGPLSAFCLKAMPWPWVWILGLCSFFSLFFFFQSESPRSRIISVNVAIIALFLALVEAALSLSATLERKQGDSVGGTTRAGTYTDPGYFMVGDDVLGYAPRRSSRVRSVVHFGDEVVYDVHYTINDQGLRITSEVPVTDPKGCLVFFGGSITFGEGLDDHETLPYMIGYLSGWRYRTYNFGFSGYGPHQMLAAIEFGVVQKIADCGPKPMYMIMQYNTQYWARIAGRSIWDPNGPMYKLDESSGVTYAGKFSDQIRLSPRVMKQLRKSVLFLRLWRLLAIEERDLYREVILAAADRFRRLFPNSEVHLLELQRYYPGDVPDTEAEDAVRDAFQAKDILVHRLGRIVPDERVDDRFRLSSHDTHPNGRRNSLVAQYLIQEVLDP